MCGHMTLFYISQHTHTGYIYGTRNGQYNTNEDALICSIINQAKKLNALQQTSYKVKQAHRAHCLIGETQINICSTTV